MYGSRMASKWATILTIHAGSSSRAHGFVFHPRVAQHFLANLVPRCSFLLTWWTLSFRAHQRGIEAASRGVRTGEYCVWLVGQRVVGIRNLAVRGSVWSSPLLWLLLVNMSRVKAEQAFRGSASCFSCTVYHSKQDDICMRFLRFVECTSIMEKRVKMRRGQSSQCWVDYSVFPMFGSILLYCYSSPKSLKRTKRARNINLIISSRHLRRGF